tara:strand:+ start:11448 stop:11933 length:486 start_codon:yes stop_codon:yes gene_type:complete
MDYKKLLRRSTPAPLWRRGIAYLIDISVVTLVVLYPLQKLLDNYTQQGSFTETFTYIQQHPQAVTQLLIISFAITLLTILYWAILDYRIRQTLGKYLVNISVVPTTKKYTFGQCVMRNITKFSTFLLLLDLVYLLFRGGNQRYTEVLSKTEVLIGGTNGKI